MSTNPWEKPKQNKVSQAVQNWFREEQRILAYPATLVKYQLLQGKAVLKRVMRPFGFLVKPLKPLKPFKITPLDVVFFATGFLVVMPVTAHVALEESYADIHRLGREKRIQMYGDVAYLAASDFMYQKYFTHPQAIDRVIANEARRIMMGWGTVIENINDQIGDTGYMAKKARQNYEMRREASLITEVPQEPLVIQIPHSAYIPPGTGHPFVARTKGLFTAPNAGPFQLKAE